ncbi:alpha beta-hydrolase [Coniophora puteana RWD-64-598 SS2]|uniref:Carboxylic ester hydrolase n=1 Tax=Coniophora puteana (strain RWD-64-598) TaxID=741705 RepID=A0A5M3MYZ2_CONPW|nr:alpha beta-hydrolase [Coniophora puteana RWD-64-598 SS2]EIW84339.1 alpha beta-hydrolase [Coniophora puteana RWD-64-598 SS2]
MFSSHRRSSLICLAWSAIALASPTSTSLEVRVEAPIVDLGYAQYQGTYNATDNLTSFLGIRYAAPPTGALRWMPPQVPAYVAGVQQADTNPDMCYQTNYGGNNTAPVPPYGLTGTTGPLRKRADATPAASEDCLYLNVFTPGATLPAEPTTTDGLPVLVWIHGGGYEAGYAAEFPGNDLLIDSDNQMVVVVMQYRLGVFGFLSSNEIKAGGAVNAGLLDQTYALQWVQENIGKFGGNAAHVTIWGESAGAGSVLQHMVANGGNTQPPLFNYAITSSTFLPSQYYYNDRVPELLYSEVLNYTGCTTAADTLFCLREADVTTLQTANYNLASSSAFYGTYVFVPVVDGEFIQERPSVTIAGGKLNGDLYFAVGNSHEGNIFVNQTEAYMPAEYVANLFPDMTQEQVEQAAYLYSDMGTPIEQANWIMGDSIFVCPTYYLLAAYPGRSWKGLFAIPPGYHGNDVIYYFNGTAPPYNNPTFINAFAQSFMSVAMYGNVNQKYDPTNITPYWEEYSAGNFEMLFNETESGAPLVAPFTTDPGLIERCAFWRGVTANTAQ